MTADRVTVDLDHPIEVDGAAVASLSLRRPLVRDLIAAERQPGEIGQEAAVIAACSGLSFEAVGRLDATDYRRVLRESQLGFFSDAAGTPDPSGAPASTAASGEPSSSSTAGPAGASPKA